MKLQSRLSLFCFAIIITFLAGCGGLEINKSDLNPEAQTNMSTQEAIKIITARFPSKSDKITLDGITIAPIGINEGFYYPFNKSSTIQIYDYHNPSQPDQTMLITLGYPEKRPWFAFSDKSSAMQFANAVYFLNNITTQERQKERQKDLDDCLRVVRGTPINVILSGATAGEFIYREAAESTLNDILIQWKNKGLPELLQKATSAQLSDLVINLEKGILNLDLEAKKLKDLADQDARQATAPGQAAPAKTAPAGALTIAHLLEQRKAILIAILGPVRQAAAQRASGG